MVHIYSENTPYQHSTAISCVFLDNDDVLYKAPKDQQDYHDAAATQAVRDQLPDLSEYEVKRLMDMSKEQGGSLDVFTHMFNADARQLRGDHYKHLIENTKDSDFFEHEEGIYGNIGKLRIAGVDVHIITHGSPQWTEHTNAQGERPLAPFFTNQGRSYTCKDDMPDHSGKTKPYIYRHARHKMEDRRLIAAEATPQGQSYAMVDDTMANLKKAKQDGMMTILVSRDGKYSDNEIADYVDLVVPDTTSALYSVIQNNALHEVMDRNAEQNPDDQALSL